MSLPVQMNRIAGIYPLDGFTRDFDNVLGRLLGGGAGEVARSASYPVDVREDADHIYIEAELPGFKKDEIDIVMEKQVLSITAQRVQTDEQNKEGWLLRERRNSSFVRSFTLPPSVSEQTVEAKLEHGLLTITLKKREESKPRKITVA